MFTYVPCAGGVWERERSIRILKHYKLDYVFSEDDWFSIGSLLMACNFWKIPFHFLTPIDSLPVNPIAFDEVFSRCDKIYVPNSSFESFNGKTRLTAQLPEEVFKRQGPNLKAVFLPHGADPEYFYPKKVDRGGKFTFLMVGRTEERKGTARAIRAFEKVYQKMDAELLIRTDWYAPQGQSLMHYIIKKNLPIVMDQTADIPQSQLNDVYNKADVNICAAKAGGFEMSVTEAGLCEVPSLVTDWTFMNENVVADKSGFRIPVESFCHPPANHNPMSLDRIWGNISEDALAEKMLWSYLNEEKMRMMGRWARDYIREKYNWKIIGETLKTEILEP